MVELFNLVLTRENVNLCLVPVGRVPGGVVPVVVVVEAVGDVTEQLQTWANSEEELTGRLS